MAKQVTFPRMTRRDCERLLDVHQQLNRVRDTLESANWAGGRACAGGIMSALVLISELYNRAEFAFIGRYDPNTAPSSENGQVEHLDAPAEAIETTAVPVDNSGR